MSDDDQPYDFRVSNAIPMRVNELGGSAVFQFWVAVERLVGPNPDLRRRIIMLENDPRGDAVLVYRSIMIFFTRLNRLVFEIKSVERPQPPADEPPRPSE